MNRTAPADKTSPSLAKMRVYSTASFRDSTRHPEVLRRIETELFPLGRFVRVSNGQPVRGARRTQVVVYSTLDPGNSLTVRFGLRADGRVGLQVQLIITQPMRAPARTAITASTVERLIRSQYGILCKSNSTGALVLTKTVGPDDGARICEMIRGVLRDAEDAAFIIYGNMRRAGQSKWISELERETFWGENGAHALSRVQETSTEMQLFRAGSISVCYTQELAGGGQHFGREVVDFIGRMIGRVEDACEWCAGPGFIGFDMLSRKMVSSLTLFDINPRAIEICNKTIAQNHLEAVAGAYLSDCFDRVPARDQWDLIVGNPPWMPDGRIISEWGAMIKYQDPGLTLHKRFFSQVGDHLRPNGHIVLIESYLGTSLENFLPLIDAAGLEVRSCVSHPNPLFRMVYYIWLAPRAYLFREKRKA